MKTLKFYNSSENKLTPANEVNMAGRCSTCTFRIPD